MIPDCLALQIFDTENQILSPIAVFAYNRPKHLRYCLNSIADNELSSSSPLVIFIDGPKNNREKDLVNECIDVARLENRFGSVEVLSQENNLGLSRSILKGVTYVLERYGSIIVLEDDMRVSPNFLNFMNAGLNLYEKNPRVSGLHAYVYPIKSLSEEAFFLRGADCWGWATWADRWMEANFDSAELLSNLETSGQSFQFDLEGAVGYSTLLKSQVEGLVDSWAIRWHAYNFIENKICLHPPVSLLKNLGNDGTGRHYAKQEIFNIDKWDLRQIVFPKIVEESQEMRSKIRDFLFSKREHELSYFAKIFRRLKNLMR